MHCYTGTEEPKYVHVTLCYVVFRIFNSFQINTDRVLYSFVNNVRSRKEQNTFPHTQIEIILIVYLCGLLKFRIVNLGV